MSIPTDAAAFEMTEVVVCDFKKGKISFAALLPQAVYSTIGLKTRFGLLRVAKPFNRSSTSLLTTTTNQPAPACPTASKPIISSVQRLPARGDPHPLKFQI